MIRTTLFSLLVLGFTSSGFAQSPLDAFEFPEFNETSKSSTDSATKNKKFVSSDADLNAHSTPVPLPVPDASLQQSGVQGEVADPLAVSGSGNHYSGMAPPQPYQPFTGFMPYGPSPVSPMLGYMTCSQNACPNVWAGFAAEHAARMAHYCSKHGCSNCGCGGHGSSLYAQPSIVAAGGHHHGKLHHNRYTQPAAPVCDGCTGR